MTLASILFAISVICAGLSYIFLIYPSGQRYYIFINIALIPVLALVLFGVVLILLFIVSLFINKEKEVKKPNKFFYWWVREVAKAVNYIGGARIKKIGFEKIDPNKHYLIVNNHISNFDQMIIIDVFKDMVQCISKKSNFKAPLMGAFIHAAGFIEIDRESAFEALKAIIKAADYIEKHNCSICISPEGTRAKDLVLKAFKAGSFKIAYKAKCPIAVVSVKNTNLIHKHFPFKRTNVVIEVLDVIEYEDFKDKNSVEVSTYAHDLIEENLKIEH